MANEAKHTPGPWKIQRGEISIGPHNKGLMVGPLQYAKVHVIGPFEKPLDDETRANARLIAAAPELLAALQDLVGDALWLKTSVANRVECAHCGRQYDETPDEALPDFCSDDCPGEIARSAISKATTP